MCERNHIRSQCVRRKDHKRLEGLGHEWTHGSQCPESFQSTSCYRIQQNSIINKLSMPGVSNPWPGAHFWPPKKPSMWSMTKCQNLRFLLFKKKKKKSLMWHQWNDGSSSGPQLSLRPLYCFCYSQREHVCRNFLTGISQFCCTILEGSVVGPDGLSGTIHFLIYEPKAETSNLATFISLS